MATLNSRDAGIAVNGSFASAIEFVGALLASGVIAVENDLVEDATALVTELGVSFAKARLAAAAEIVADYPDPPAAKRGGGGGGGYKKGGKNTTSKDPASDKQIALIEDLNDKKGASIGTEGLTKASASEKIDELFAMADAE